MIFSASSSVADSGSTLPSKLRPTRRRPGVDRSFNHDVADFDSRFGPGVSVLSRVACAVTLGLKRSAVFDQAIGEFNRRPLVWRHVEVADQMPFAAIDDRVATVDPQRDRGVTLDRSHSQLVRDTFRLELASEQS